MAAPATVLLSILLMIISVVVKAAHPSPPSYEARLVKECAEALGPGGASLVTFCARDFLGHKAAALADYGNLETTALVLTESYNRVQAFEDFGMKIASDKGKDAGDLKRCWELMNDVVSSVGNIYGNVALKKLSMAAVLNGAYERAAVANGKCNFSAAGRHGGVWLELELKAKDTVKAEIVALAFMNQFHPVLN